MSTVFRNKPVSKDGWHPVKALGSATSSISQCVLGRPSFEKLQTSDVPLPGWKVFACHMSYVILTDIIQTVLETLECFLSNTTNNMHILATETEEQAVYFGHLIHPSFSILSPSHKKNKASIKVFSQQSILHSCCQTYPRKTDHPADTWLWQCNLQNSLQHFTKQIGCSLSQCHPFCHQRPMCYPPLRPVCSCWLALASYPSPSPLAPGHLQVSAR